MMCAFCHDRDSGPWGLYAVGAPAQLLILCESCATPPNIVRGSE